MAMKNAWKGIVVVGKNGYNAYMSAKAVPDCALNFGHPATRREARLHHNYFSWLETTCLIELLSCSKPFFFHPRLPLEAKLDEKHAQVDRRLFTDTCCQLIQWSLPYNPINPQNTMKYLLTVFVSSIYPSYRCVQILRAVCICLVCYFILSASLFLYVLFSLSLFFCFSFSIPHQLKRMQLGG